MPNITNKAVRKLYNTHPRASAARPAVNPEWANQTQGKEEAEEVVKKEWNWL